ncbi:chromosomal replication initiator protein DnaA [Ktedonospora formicarum]|uniref:Chromosomal replication initiator protein DnaA n=1 Tax=Ktedonospora formicarum TaxID=2778364 RepID=A0A8J3I0N5_9CHLR|nr:chromosomal replication initiator protein DnaA [Ktedonospora formicarum]GHO43384.1 chromosomal replication initiator protein DnaA [Ktedonospora formicarum]
MNARQIWQTAIERLQERVQPNTFTTWFQGTSAYSFQDGVFVVGVSSTFAKTHLERRFTSLIHSILTEITGMEIEVQFIVARDRPEPNAPSEQLFSSPRRLSRLNKARTSPAQHVRRFAESAAAVAKKSKASLSFQTLGMGQKPGTPSEDYLLSIPPQHSQPEGDILAPPMAGQAKPHPTPSAITFGAGGPLNQRYTFDAFIVGKSNQLAHAASLAASENPGRIYNPLFLYGGVGLGKTHLLHAVGHAGESRGLTVLYVTSEKFTNEIINAIRYQKTEEFRAKYRQIDILLVDDIQFIAGKESTEEEFFHTFNSLHNANKQIVVTSDRPPKAIHSLQDRLRSRFEWGLLADVQAPEYEHRLAILRSKTELLHFAVPNPVVEYVARPECSSVRELEGALNRVIAFATLRNVPITEQLAADALANIYSNKKPVTSGTKLSIIEVIDGVCRYYNVESERIRGKQRDRDIMWPRQVAMYLMREETTASLQQIGAELGGRDHTTVMHGWEKVQAEMQHNDRVRHEIATVLESLQSRSY